MLHMTSKDNAYGSEMQTRTGTGTRATVLYSSQARSIVLSGQDLRHGGEHAGAGTRRPHRLQCVEHECHALHGLSPCGRPPCQNNTNGAPQAAPFFAGRRGRWPGSRVKKGSTGGFGRILNETSAKGWKRRLVASSDAEYHCQCKYSRRRGRRRHGFLQRSLNGLL
jgi:hypothetical protein